MTSLPIIYTIVVYLTTWAGCSIALAVIMKTGKFAAHQLRARRRLRRIAAIGALRRQIIADRGETIAPPLGDWRGGTVIEPGRIAPDLWTEVTDWEFAAGCDPIDQIQAARTVQLQRRTDRMVRGLPAAPALLHTGGPGPCAACEQVAEARSVARERDRDGRPRCDRRCQCDDCRQAATRSPWAAFAESMVQSAVQYSAGALARPSTAESVAAALSASAVDRFAQGVNFDNIFPAQPAPIDLPNPLTLEPLPAPMPLTAAIAAMMTPAPRPGWQQLIDQLVQLAPLIAIGGWRIYWSSRNR